MGGILDDVKNEIRAPPLLLRLSSERVMSIIKMVTLPVLLHVVVYVVLEIHVLVDSQAKARRSFV